MEAEVLELGVLGAEKTILLGDGLTRLAIDDILASPAQACRTFVIVTDANIAGLYLKDFVKAFQEAGVPFQSQNEASTDATKSRRLLTFIIPAGETSKCRAVKAQLEDFLLDRGCNRDTCLLALGGGVVGDLVGYVSSTYLRGIPLVQLPTTLLAMVDSSIGGKNGIDTPAGKNLIGTIWQPARVFVDLRFLTSLPAREFFNGMAEIIKTAAISSQADFQYLESVAEELAGFFKELGDLSLEKRKLVWVNAKGVRSKLRSIIFSSIQFKVRVVNADVRDNGLRHLLNFGHTIGHAIELYLAPKVLHGECVAVGIILELMAAEELGACDPSTTDRLRKILSQFILPVSVSDPILTSRIDGQVIPTIEQILRAMRLDKKNSGGEIQMIVMNEIGRPSQPRAVPVSEPIIIKAIESMLASNEAASNEVASDEVLVKPEADVPEASNDSSIVVIGAQSVANLADALAEQFGHRYLAPDPGALTLSSILAENSRSSVIYCDEHVVQTADEALQSWMAKDGIVIHVKTDHETLTQAQFFRGHSNFTGSNRLQGLVHLVNYTRRALPQPMPSQDLPRSFFLCLIAPNVSSIVHDLPVITAGAHAVELRVDLLQKSASIPPPNFHFSSEESILEFEDFVAEQVALIRTAVGATGLPIIYTVRTVAEGGKVPDNLEPGLILRLYLGGVRLGCEIIDLQMTVSPEEILTPFLKAAKGRSKVIGSYHHITSPLNWCGPEYKQALDKCSAIGDMVKIVSVASCPEDNRALEATLEAYQGQGSSSKPLIALNMGKVGQVSRLTNRYFTPVTHPLLHTIQVPGLSQLSIPQIHQGLTLMGQLIPKAFYLFGYPIGHSLSPLLHSTIFSTSRLPHTYELFESLDLAQVEKVIRDPNFGGGSVTIPHKLSIIPLLDSISEAALSIGAVNTIIPHADGKLHGDNTDWLGVLKCLERAVRGGHKESRSTALVLGAGGTARAMIYALEKFGASRIYIYNRTPSRLQELVEHFGRANLIGLGSLKEVLELGAGPYPPFVIIDTCPSDAGILTEELVSGAFGPLKGSGIVVQLAYSKETEPGLVHVTGTDILLEQGLVQARLWTGLNTDSDYLRAQFYEGVKLRSQK